MTGYKAFNLLNPLLIFVKYKFLMLLDRKDTNKWIDKLTTEKGDKILNMLVLNK